MNESYSKDILLSITKEKEIEKPKFQKNVKHKKLC